MNKKLITLAIAAAMAAPAAALAEATLYGKAHVSLDYVDVDDYATWGGVPYGGGDFGLDGAVEGYLGAGFDYEDVRVDPETRTVTSNGLSTDFDGVNVGGFVEDIDGLFETVVDPITGETPAEFYGDRLQELVDQGADPQVASVQAFKEAVGFANQNATNDQLVEAVSRARLNAGSNKFKGWGMNQNHRASRIGVKGSEDLGGGLKAIYQIEMGVDLTNESRDDNIANGNRGDGFYLRNTFVGLAGNFGTFLMGRHDTPLKISTGKLDMFADTLADYNYTIGFHDVRADSAVAYISPSWSGFQFAGAVIPSGGATPGTGWNPDADGIAEAFSLAAIYSNGPFYASAAYESLGSEHWSNQNVVYRGLYARDADDDKKWRIGLGLLDWNGFSLTGVYESRSNVLGAPKRGDSKLWQVQAGYAFGNNMIKGMYGQSDNEDCADPFVEGFRYLCDSGLGLAQAKDTDAWAVGFDHNFSKRTKAYALYTAVSDDNDEADWSGFSLGMIHSF